MVTPASRARPHVFSTGGDGFGVAFERAGDAIRSAFDLRQALWTLDWPAQVDLRVRMGVHSGEAAERDGNYFGSSVNRAARLLDLARGGQVVVSSSTAPLVEDDLPPGTTMMDTGVHRLRGLARDERVFLLVVPGRKDTFGPLRLASGNLPSPLTSFVGRSSDVQRLTRDLPTRRLLTLTGVGGVGKTRLALEVAWAARDQFVSAWFVELGSVTDRSAVVHAVAFALNIEPEPGSEGTDAIVRAVAGRRILVILDNCEHVLDEVSRLVEQLVTRCPAMTLLTTSREPLGVDGERTVVVRSLDASSGAVLLRGTGRGGVERHQTLRAAVAWSYQLLTAQERALFDRCSVFAGHFDEAAARAVCTGDDLDADDVLDVLAALVDRNMLVAVRDGAETRYRLLETLRQYGEEQLAAATDTYQARHARYYLERAELLDQKLKHSDFSSGIAGYFDALDNLRVTMQWALASSDPLAEELVRSTMTFAQVVLVPEVGAWVFPVLAAHPDNVFLHGAAAYTALTLEGDSKRCIELARAGLARASSPDDPATADCWSALGFATALNGGEALLVETVTCSVPLYLRSGQPVHAVMVLAALAGLVTDADQATTLATEARLISQPLGSQLADVNVALATSGAARRRGDAPLAVEILLPHYERLNGLRVRGNARTNSLWILGLSLADDPTAMDGAALFLRDALTDLHADGYDFRLAHGMWLSALYLTAVSRPEPAAVIFGHLDANTYQFGGSMPEGRRALDAVRAQPLSGVWRERGARLSQEEAFIHTALALETSHVSSASRKDA